MSLSAPRLLWLLAALLLGVLVVEALPSKRSAPALVQASAARVIQAASGVAEPVAAWVAITVTRPLFSINRRPPAPVSAVANADKPQALPRLTGIIVSPIGRSAIFAGEGDHSTVVAEGASIGAWRVIAIHANAVDVAGPQGDRMVKPAYSSEPPPAVAQAAPPNQQPAALAAFLAASQQPIPGAPPMPAQLQSNLPNELLRDRR